MSYRPDTSALLEEVEAFLRTYIVFPAEHLYAVVALWVLHTHALAAAETTPRLQFKSPEKESGKTRALEVLELLVPHPLFSITPTPAVIYRLLKDEPATVLFDEADAFFKPHVDNHEDLRALINEGYRRGATVPRMVGEGKKMKVERFPVFAPIALAAIGNLPETVESRSLVIPMRRRAPAEEVTPFRRREVVEPGHQLRDDIAEWAAAYVPLLEPSRPVMPDGVTDRAADCWEPLLAIADLAGEPWATRARDAAAFMVKGRVADDLSTGVRLLADIKVAMDGSTRMSSGDLCIALNAVQESPWGGWHEGKGIDQRDVARRLRPYDIRPKNIRLPDGTVPKGYLREDFDDAFSRYLRTAATRATAATSPHSDSNSVALVADVAPPEEGGDLDPDQLDEAYRDALFEVGG